MESLPDSWFIQQLRSNRFTLHNISLLEAAWQLSPSYFLKNEIIFLFYLPKWISTIKDTETLEKCCLLKRMQITYFPSDCWMESWVTLLLFYWCCSSVGWRTHRQKMQLLMLLTTDGTIKKEHMSFYICILSGTEISLKQVYLIDVTQNNSFICQNA